MYFVTKAMPIHNMPYKEATFVQLVIADSFCTSSYSLRSRLTCTLTDFQASKIHVHTSSGKGR